MKIKYWSLTKDERKKARNDFYKTEFGKNISSRLTRLLVTGILGFLFSLYLLIFHESIWDITSGFLLLIASIVFIISSIRLRIRNINDFITKK